ncbi:MAG: nuclear transport factor 2 family protein [Alphaproteobacteria bacterium]|nr:nuclear transport factor 2 family protein [Alphaproteobacteria bacterium]
MAGVDGDPAAVVGAVYERFGRGDLDGIVALLAPDAVWHLPGPAGIPNAGTWRGPAGVRDWFAAFGAAVAIEAFAVDRMLAAGDTVVALGRERARAKATGKVFETSFAHVWTVAGGRIAGFTDTLDTAAVAAAFVRP